MIRLQRTKPHSFGLSILIVLLCFKEQRACHPSKALFLWMQFNIRPAFKRSLQIRVRQTLRQTVSVTHKSEKPDFIQSLDRSADIRAMRDDPLQARFQHIKGQCERLEKAATYGQTHSFQGLGVWPEQIHQLFISRLKRWKLPTAKISKNPIRTDAAMAALQFQ